MAKRLYMGVRGKSQQYLTALSQRTGPAIAVAEEEVDSWSSWHPMSLRHRLWLWRHGFLSKDGIAYGLTRNDHRQYLSNYEARRAGLINGRWSVVNANKLVFHRMLERFDEHRMTVYGRTRHGRFTPVDELAGAGTEDERTHTPMQVSETHSDGVPSSAARTTTTEWLDNRLRTGETLVLKPIYGGMGKGILVCSWADGTHYVNGTAKTPAEFDAVVSDLDNYLVCEFVEQAAYADEWFPDASNTLRIVTMWDAERDEAFVPMAVHRIGTQQSAPVDNCSQGGLTAEIDLETGEVGRGAQPPYADESDWHTTHPDTGARIEGTSVPGWPTIRDEIVDIAATFTNVPYIGWDVIVTGNGDFTIVEANNNPDTRLLQVHRPLLADPRTRRFYEYHNIV